MVDAYMHIHRVTRMICSVSRITYALNFLVAAAAAAACSCVQCYSPYKIVIKELLFFVNRSHFAHT